MAALCLIGENAPLVKEFSKHFSLPPSYLSSAIEELVGRSKLQNGIGPGFFDGIICRLLKNTSKLKMAKSAFSVSKTNVNVIIQGRMYILKHCPVSLLNEGSPWMLGLIWTDIDWIEIFQVACLYFGLACYPWKFPPSAALASVKSIKTGSNTWLR